MEGIQITVCEKQTESKNEYDFQILTSAVFVTGWIWLYSSAFSFWKTDWILLAVTGVLISAVFAVLLGSRWQEYVFPAGTLLAVLVFLLGFSYGKNGMLLMANEFLGFLTGKTGKIYLDYPTVAEKGVWFTGILITCVLALFTAKAVKMRNVWPMLLLAFPGVLGIAAGFLQTDISLLLLVGGIALLLYQKNCDVLSGKIGRISVGISVLMLASCFVIAIGIGALMPDLSKNGWAAGAKEQLHKWQYGCEMVTMPEGDLSNLGAWIKEERPVLEIETENPEKLYVRGMIGEVYTGTSWEAFGAETRKESESLFYWLHQSGYYGQSSIGSALTVLDELEPYTMTIYNLAACGKYQYLPYALAGTETLDTEQVGDGSAFAEKQVQTIECFPGSVPEWYGAEIALAEKQQDDEVSEYLRKEQSYREFVYENDLQMTNASVGVCRRLFGESNEGRGLAEIQDLIRTTLENGLTYNELVTTANGENDFLQYTMEQSKRGYSIHYATAATLMFRYLGVPARYVEGYFLPAQEAKAYEKGDTIVLTDAHAHAWTEYYLEGVGWVPFEVTPGYIDEEEIQAMTQMMEDSLQNNSCSGKSFARSNLKYTPPKYSEDEKKITELNDLLRYEVQEIVVMVLIVLLILVILAAVLAAIVFILKRRKRLIHTLHQIRNMDDKEAIAALFGYASMLMEKAKMETSDGLEKVRKINEEAIFSNHEMTKAQREEAENFTLNIISECKTKWKPLERFRYHYILWLYR